MHKMRKFALVLSFLLVAGFCGNAWAYDATDHVSIAPNLKGDVLVYPVYFADSGWETKLTVINTSTTHCVIAKLVVRSALRSQEIRDFILFLTPTDVWTGTVYYNASAGRVYIRSTDDSCYNNSGVAASEAAPLDIYVEDVCTGDVSTIGYIEVISGGAINLGNPPVAKATLMGFYEAWKNYEGTVGSAAAKPPVTFSGYTVVLPMNVLTGLEEITNTTINTSFGITPTVLKNVDYHAHVIKISLESLLGSYDNNTLVEWEAALAKNSLAVPYYTGDLGVTLFTATFPTKMAGFQCGVNNWHGPYSGFPDVQYTLSAYDLQENSITVTQIFSPLPQIISTLPYEVNTLLVADFESAVGTFEEGWMLFTLDAGPTTAGTLSCPACADITYTGSPVIATAMRLNTSLQGGWQYVAHDLGDVTVNGVAEPQYNYFVITNPADTADAMDTILDDNIVDFVDGYTSHR